jgi:N-acetyl-1-D-myo-inositol-2-amino-2-deoxy-alpha-D-glucopyranoside deacetylase
VPGALDGQTVLAIFAHPDDESLTCGGTLARLTDSGANVVLLCATRGERGSVSDLSLVQDTDLASVRTRELYDAAAVLGITNVVVLDHRDGNLRWEHVTELHAEIVALVEQHRPSAVITFDGDGLYWHLDHIGIHERTFTAVRSFGDAAPALYYVTMAKGIMREVVEAARARGAALPEANVWGIEPEAFGAGAEPATLTIDVRPWVARKLAALRCHRTQMGPRHPIAWIDDDQARRWLGVEYFRRASIPSVDSGVLESIGETV